ncbi:MAG: monovalent cation:proton antiporter-2 (CPA2) family protein [Burkholderiales bacterium]
MSLLVQTAIFLSAMVLAVPLSRRLGLGAILGYLIAGVAIGPWGLGLVSDVENVLHFSELGVVLLLFVIGLELEPSRLWRLRKAVFGMGAAQVFTSGAVFALAGIAFGLPYPAAIIVGLALAMSSTAFALQMLAERKELTARHGRSAFAILLFQDLIAIPILALIPLYGAGVGASSFSLVDAVTVLGVLAAVVIGGRYILRPILRIIAAVRTQEVFTAFALLIVIGTALIVQSVGISMALGAFMAGVLLADSEYRHELEADIEPFRGLLLGLFFIAVGMSANVGLVLDQPLLVLGIVAGLLGIKFLVLFVLAKVNGASNASARKLGFSIGQGGEFAFVILALAVGAGMLAQSVSDLMVVAVTLSIAATPLLLFINDALFRSEKPREKEFDRPSEDNAVIIAGFGRFGQIVARILRARKIGFTALEISPEQVDFVGKYGNKIYYGDASRLELLRAARTEQAKVFVLAIDEIAASLRTAEMVRKHFPEVKIYARARNRKHAYQLMDLGVALIWRETFLSSLDMAREILRGLGLSKEQSERAVQTFRKHDEARLIAHHESHNDEERMIYLAQKATQELEELFAQDVGDER